MTNFIYLEKILLTTRSGRSTQDRNNPATTKFSVKNAPILAETATTTLMIGFRRSFLIPISDELIFSEDIIIKVFQDSFGNAS